MIPPFNSRTHAAPTIPRPTTADRLAGMTTLRQIMRLPPDDDEAARLTIVLEHAGWTIARLPGADVLPFPDHLPVVEAPCDVEPGPETAA